MEMVANKTCLKNILKTTLHGCTNVNRMLEFLKFEKLDQEQC
jgi:hypothetical protein